MIEFKNVSCEYEAGTPVIRDVSFAIESGHRVGLIGANGAGKSTIMKALLGLIPHKGQILVDGVEVNKANLSKIHKAVGFVLQNSDNQMFMPTIYDDMMFGPLNFGISEEDANARVDKVLTDLNITHLKNKYNHKISGGEKRMGAIATILAMEPSVIVMDEPSASLDPYNRRIVINAIHSRKETMIIASHDLDMILDLCDKVILVGSGEIKAYGDAREILTNKELLESNRLELPLAMQ